MTPPTSDTSMSNMGEIHIRIEADHAPTTIPELIDYLRTMACVDFETGRRVMPRFIDDEVFDRAADLIEVAYITREVETLKPDVSQLVDMLNEFDRLGREEA